MARRLGVLLAAAVASVAIWQLVGDGENTGPAPHAGEAPPTPVGDAAPALGEDVEYATADGVAISGSFAAPGDGEVPAAILLHALGSDRQDFAALAPLLRRRGIATLAPDLRGAGRSLQRSPSRERYVPPLEEGRLLRLMQRDVEAAVRFLRTRAGVDPDRIVLIGVGAGASVAWRASASAAGIRGAVALGPAVALDELPPLRRRPPRGVLLVTQRLQVALSHDLSRRTARPKRVVLAHGELAGVGLLGDPAVEREVLDWLDRLMG